MVKVSDRGEHTSLLHPGFIAENCYSGADIMVRITSTSIITLIITMFSIMTPSILTPSTMTLSIKILSIMPLGIMSLGTMTLSVTIKNKALCLVLLWLVILC